MAKEAAGEVEKLKSELFGLFQYIQRVRQEIAAFHRPADEENQITSMAEQLDAIVKATETATNTIMETVEDISGLLDHIRDDLTDKQKGVLKRVDAKTNIIFEACSFQDITGQRVSKIMKSITYVETRVNTLIEVWGKEELDRIKVDPEHIKTDDESLLNGPQLDGLGLDQSAIDALFD
ncbi:MAG: hypothetical protein HQ501_06925 [Rhodospirillales bacterium]|nr:hypothetical protein [Rhodospirillales bacterium]